MKLRFRSAPVLFLALALLVVAAAGAARGAAAAHNAAGVHATAKHYICPPCGSDCDAMVFDKPGICPKCGMTLVEGEPSKAPATPNKKVAFLLFNGAEVIDFAGPYEMFGVQCDVYTVGETGKPVTTSMGLTVVPKYTFADAPRPDVLVVPGGGVKASTENQALLKWVSDTTARDQVTMSVCNGAFILAKAGLLDGLTATTTAGNIDRLAEQFPRTKVVRDQRFVDNGKIVTTGGLSAGMDGALHVIGRLLGEGAAENTALIEEYDWKANANYAPAMLAEKEIPNVNLSDVGQWDVVRTAGSTTRWEISLRGSSALGGAALMDHVAKALETGGKWKPAGGGSRSASAGGASDAATRSWSFTGHDGRSWGATLRIEGMPGEAQHYTATLDVSRAS